MRLGAVFSLLLLAGTLPAQDPGPIPPMNSTFGGGTLGGFTTDAPNPVVMKLRTIPPPEVGAAFELELVLEHAEGYHTYAPGEKLGAPVEVRLPEVPGIEWGEPVFPPGKEKEYPLLGGALQLYEGTIVVKLPGKVVSEAGRRQSWTITVEYSACTDTACLLPQEVEVPSMWTGGKPPPSSTPAPVPGAEPGGDFQRNLEAGLLWALLVAYAWGLAASISPCVYPMIPVTIAFFGSQSEDRSRARTFVLALAYVAGIVLTYAVAGLVAARLGQDVGALLVNPWVVGLVSGMLFAMGLSLFGLFEMRLPYWIESKLSASGEGKGLGKAFVTGAVMGLVAAPCVGPFAASILVFVAKSGDLLVGGLALGSFGLGIGTLFLVLALGVSELPSSGVWLITVKKFMGYVLFGAAFYFLSQILPSEWILLGWGVWLAVGGVMGGALEPAETSGARASRGLMLLALVAGLYLTLAGLSQRVPLNLAGGSGAPVAVQEGAWIRSFEEARAEAARTGKPIFADFYADWCIPCKQMEAEVFPDPEVKRLFESFVLAKLDCTQPDSPGAVMKNKQLGVPSMPYLAIFDSRGEHRADLSNPGYLGVEDFRVLLEKARSELEG